MHSDATQEPLTNPTCLRHLVFPIRMCWHTSFWTTGWELLSSWVRKLIQKPCNHQKIWQILPNVYETTEIQKTHFLYSSVNNQNASGHLPHRVSAECSCRGCLQHIWGPCREYAGCSGVCGQSRPSDAYPPVCVLPDKNCNEQQTHFSEPRWWNKRRVFITFKSCVSWSTHFHNKLMSNLRIGYFWIFLLNPLKFPVFQMSQDFLCIL